MKPYITGEFDGVPFEINNRYQVACENIETKRILKELVIEGLKEYNEEKSWSKWVPQFYITDKFEKHKELPVTLKRVYRYIKGTTIEHVEDQYFQSKPKLIYIEGTLYGFPFTAYTDLTAKCDCPEPEKTGIKDLVELRLGFLYTDCCKPEIPQAHVEVIYRLMKDPYYKIQKAYCYPSRPVKRPKNFII